MFADINVLLTKVSQNGGHLGNVQDIRQQFATAYGLGQENAFRKVTDLVNNIKTYLNFYFVSDTSSKALADWLIKYASDQHAKLNGQSPGKTLDDSYSLLKEQYMHDPVGVRVRALCVPVEVLWGFVQNLTDTDVFVLIQKAYELLLPAHKYLTGSGSCPTTDEVRAILQQLEAADEYEYTASDHPSKQTLLMQLQACRPPLNAYIDSLSRDSPESQKTQTIPLVTVPKNRNPAESQKTRTIPLVTVPKNRDPALKGNMHIRTLLSHMKQMNFISTVP